MEIVFQSERLFFRKFSEADGGLLYELDSDPEVMRFITGGRPTPREMIQTDILPRILGYYQKLPFQGVWAAHTLANNEFIGWFHFRPDKLTPEQMEIGYRLKRTAWGKGYATEGARQLVERGFAEWGAGLISARTLAGNIKSQQVLEKAGLTFEHEFYYPPSMGLGLPTEQLRAFKYGFTKDAYEKQSNG